MADLSNSNIYPPVINPLKKGRPLHYTPERLAEKFAEYVKWAQEHPIIITRTSSGVTDDSSFNRTEEETKPQRVSVTGFLVWLGEGARWYSELEHGADGGEFSKVKAYIRAYCEDNQTTLASVGLYKENIISRLLGLTDKKEVSMESPTIVVKSEEEKQKIENIGNLGV